MQVPSLDELVKKAGNPKVLPFVAKKIIDLASDDNSSIGDICGTIEKDQTITTSILKIANSAYYGLPSEVTSIRQAVLLLGFRAVKELVITVSTKLQYKKFGITEQLLWEHSIGAAVSARIITANLGSELQEIAFLGGLMHDFGKVVMNNESPESFLSVMQEIYNEGVDSLVAEENVFGYTHAEVGAKVIAEWGFPPVLSKVLEGHHLNTFSLDTIEDPFIAKAVACIHLADNFCKRLGIGYRDPDEGISLLSLPSAEFLGLTQERIDHLTTEIGDVYEQEKTAFQ